MADKDRFDLEQAIMNCWSTADDLALIVEKVLDDPDGDMDEDTLANTLIGLQHLHHLRSRKVFDIFEELIATGQMRDPYFDEDDDDD